MTDPVVAAQSESEGAVPTVTVAGREFRCRRLSPFAFMLFSRVAKRKTSTEIDQGDAMLGLLEGAIHPDDWEAFFDHCAENVVDSEGLNAVVNAVLEAQSGFPTASQSSLPQPPTTTTPSLTASPSSLVHPEFQTVDEFLAVSRG